MLHDVGKLAIPDAILNKPGPLTPDEWAIMRQHSMHGLALLSPIEPLSSILDIPHYHHECWDGLGYPEKLSGEAIPLFARIFCLVDVYDSLLSKRPYKAAMADDDVKEIIRYQRGKQFDPEILDHFLINFDLLKKAVEDLQIEDTSVK